MQMRQRDWYDYLDYLRSQVKGVDLKNPKSAGEAYNNHVVMQDINDITDNRIKRTTGEKKSDKEQA